MFAFLRGKITRAECDARIVALRDTPAAAGMSFEERDALASASVDRMEKIIDESGGRWQ